MLVNTTQFTINIFLLFQLIIKNQALTQSMCLSYWQKDNCILKVCYGVSIFRLN